MNKARFTDSQIIDALKRVKDCLPILEFSRGIIIISDTYYKWTAKYGWITILFAIGIFVNYL